MDLKQPLTNCSHCLGSKSKNDNLCQEHFRQLRSKWYEKLRQKGFEDIEQDDEHLKIWSSYFFKVKFNATVFEAKEEYYRLAGQFLHEHKFETKTQKTIWELHSEGKSIRQIVLALKKKGVKTYKYAVHNTIQRLIKVMVDTKCPK